ncbi:MAG: hypothetical protein HUJ56_07035, partial [Erysipelotrichaceae bacterium]|nr:hypothetical protein [Erysipelotrichaceae bacterium]
QSYIFVYDGTSYELAGGVDGESSSITKFETDLLTISELTEGNIYTFSNMSYIIGTDSILIFYDGAVLPEFSPELPNGYYEVVGQKGQASDKIKLSFTPEIGGQLLLCKVNNISVDPYETYLPIKGGTLIGGLFGKTTDLATSKVIDPINGAAIKKTITTNTTFEFTKPPTGADFSCFNLVLVNGGNYTVTFPSSVKWEEATAPELTKNGTDVLSFMTIDNGTTWYGVHTLKAVG